MKPVFYHDIDGILFGEYGPRKTHQLRPGIADWFHYLEALCVAYDFPCQSRRIASISPHETRSDETAQPHGH